MDLVKVSLEALLQRATNPQNQNIDIAAVEAFCALVNKEKEGPTIAIKLLATRMHSNQEQEVLQTLHVLDTSMQKCGSIFQSEVGKFRFLNEMIKLVSPKYLGSHTPTSVKQKVLQLMYLWTLDYPKETKIKEAYDMLKKQGVIRDVPLSVSAQNCTADQKSISLFQDEEKSKLLKKLLQSKNPEDLQAANRLIKSMVKEDEKKAELKIRRVSELESIHNNVKLLNEMLDSYRPGQSSQDEFDLIKELHESCERLRPNLNKLAADTSQNEDLREILQANDDLGQVLDKFALIIVQGKSVAKAKSELGENTLLDLLHDSSAASSNVDLLNNTIVQSHSNIDVLNDIFSTPNISKEDSDDAILKPLSINSESLIAVQSTSKTKGLDDLDVLGERLLKESLQGVSSSGLQFKKAEKDKTPLSLLLAKTESSQSSFDSDKATASVYNNFNLDTLIGKSSESCVDDALVNLDEKDILSRPEVEAPKTPEIKLSQLAIDIKSIKPSSIPPITALEDKNGISVVFNFGKDKPHEHVTVIVVTITSKNENAVNNILFRAIVPKSCRVRLQTASDVELPPHNPFLPPSAITQVMLISNPENVPVQLKFIVSYTIDDELMTEMGEIDPLPEIPTDLKK